MTVGIAGVTSIALRDVLQTYSMSDAMSTEVAVVTEMGLKETLIAYSYTESANLGTGVVTYINNKVSIVGYTNWIPETVSLAVGTVTLIALT